MSVQPQPWPDPSEEIAAAVRKMYRGRRAPLPVVIRDELGELFTDEQFAAAFGVRGRPGWSPARLALVTALQFAENLTDRQAADAPPTGARTGARATYNCASTRESSTPACTANPPARRGRRRGRARVLMMTITNGIHVETGHHPNPTQQVRPQRRHAWAGPACGSRTRSGRGPGPPSPSGRPRRSSRRPRRAARR